MTRTFPSWGSLIWPVILPFAMVAQLSGCSQTTEQNEVWVIGLDGADWDILDPMIAADELPNLAALREEGSYGRLRSDEPMLSPILWTSIATGKTADQHGITWFMTDGAKGEKIPISSRNRQVRALWNIASEADRNVGIIGWWATWPVEPLRGFLVSDYVGWHSFGVTGRQMDVPGKVWPAEWQPWVLERISDPAAVDDALLQTMVHLPSSELGFDAARGPFGGPLPHLRQAVATARGYTDIAIGALAKKRPQLLCVYYEGTDAVEHLFGQYMPPRQEWVSESDFAIFRDAVRGYWQYQDELLGELLAQRRSRTTVLLVSDHGFRQGDERLREERFEIDRADASHMKDGIIVIAGPGVRIGKELRGATIYDVAPTVLHLLGLAVAEDMKGEVIAAAFDSPEAATVERIATYETGSWDRGGDLVVDPAAGQQMEEMLRSLGYISGGDGKSTVDGDDSDAMTVENAINLAVVYEQQGRFAEAIEVLEGQLERRPQHFATRLNLAQILAAAGDFDRALPLYAELEKQAPRDLELLEDYGLALGHAGRNAEAAAVFGRGLAIDENWADGWAGLGFAQYKMGQREGAIEALDRALQTDDRLARAHYYRGVLSRDRGDTSAAKQSFERCLRLDPAYEDAVLELAHMDQQAGDLPRARQRLADFLDRVGDVARVQAEVAAVDLKMGQPARALPLLVEASQQRPTDPTILGNLGVAQVMTGDMTGARRSFERTLELDPNSADAHARLGNFYAETGNTTKAMRHLKRALEISADDVPTLFSLGTLYHQAGRLDDAMPLYERALELDPDNAIAMYQLAMAMGQKGNRTRAIELLQRARKLDPSLPMPGGQ